MTIHGVFLFLAMLADSAAALDMSCPMAVPLFCAIGECAGIAALRRFLTVGQAPAPLEIKRLPAAGYGWKENRVPDMSVYPEVIHRRTALREQVPLGRADLAISDRFTRRIK